MSNPMLRLVRESDAPPPAVSDEAEDARIEAEYQQALLLLDISDYERANGPNAYTTYVRKHGKRPPPAEAKTLALVIGKRVKADDGRFYPKKTKAQRQLEREEKKRREARAVVHERSFRLRLAITDLADMDLSPADIEMFYLDERAIQTKLQSAVEWLTRFAMLRQPNGQDTRTEDTEPCREVNSGAS